MARSDFWFTEITNGKQQGKTWYTKNTQIILFEKLQTPI
jgi:hypothetical protein